MWILSQESQIFVTFACAERLDSRERGIAALVATTHDQHVIATTSAGITDRLDFDDPSRLSDVVFCCFFRSEAFRADFLDSIRGILAVLGMELPSALQEGPPEDAEALEQAMHAWYAATGKGYHAYRLRISVGPYRTSCAIAFREVSPQVIGRRMVEAVTHMEEGRGRVLSAFQFGNKADFGF